MTKVTNMPRHPVASAVPSAIPLRHRSNSSSSSSSRDNGVNHEEDLDQGKSGRGKLSEGVKLRIHFDDVTHPGFSRFQQNVPLTTLLQEAVDNVEQHLFTATSTRSRPPQKPMPNPRKWEAQEVRSITLIVYGMDGVAYTTGTRLDEAHKEIHLSLDYARAQESKTDEGYLHEMRGVATHEMVHVWQHNGRGTCPGGLIEGIADYVRMKSGLGAQHWSKFPANEETRGEKWDEGYQRTAWFLLWVEGECGGDMVGRLNHAMQNSEWEDGKLFEEVTGKKVDKWWKLYKAAWKHMQDDE